MPHGAIERFNLATIERHIRETEEHIATLESMSEQGGPVTSTDKIHIQKKKELLEALYERRLVILKSWLPEHDPTRS